MCFPPITQSSDYWNGAIPSIIGSIILVIGYVWQSKSIKKQLVKQKEISDAQITVQKVATDKQLHLSILQALVNLAIQKAKDCNDVFLKEFERVREAHRTKGNHNFNPYGENELFGATISEMVISSELINNIFQLYLIGGNLITEEDKRRVVYTYWKQLSTDVRGIFCIRSFTLALNIARVEPQNIRTYSYQIKGVYEFCNRIGDDMEGKPKEQYEELVAILNKPS